MGQGGVSPLQNDFPRTSRIGGRQKAEHLKCGMRIGVESPQKRTTLLSSPTEGEESVEGNEGDSVGETPTGATGSPKAFGPLPQLFGLQPVKSLFESSVESCFRGNGRMARASLVATGRL